MVAWQALQVKTAHGAELTLLSIDKISLENVGVFQFKISPYLINMQNLNLKKDINFTCKQNMSVRDIQLNNDGLLDAVINHITHYRIS